MAGTFTNLLTHVIFSTKNRTEIIPPEFEEELYAYIGGIINGERGYLIAAGGTSNHIHLLARFPHALSLSEMLQRIKGHSSKWVKVNEGQKISSHFSWQRGYGAFAVSESVKESVVSYINNQKEHHRKLTFQEEFVQFLKRHQIDYDERHIWG